MIQAEKNIQEEHRRGYAETDQIGEGIKLLPQFGICSEQSGQKAVEEIENGSASDGYASDLPTIHTPEVLPGGEGEVNRN